MISKPYTLILFALACTACLTLMACADDDLAQSINDGTTVSTDAGTDDLTQDMSLPAVDMSATQGDASGDTDQHFEDLEDMTDEIDLAPEPPAPSRCSTTSRRVTCTFNTTTLDIDGINRDIHWQVPGGRAPAQGWPVVIFFQGSLFSAGLSWDNGQLTPYGAYELTMTIKALLDAGYAVIAPEASLNGSTFWDTNIWPYSNDWESSNDHELMLELFAQLEEQTFGKLDPDTLFATGISSGGYMTSRMAVAYPGKFKALAVASASYATCGGIACSVPDGEDLPADHPPTLFLHGSLDATVPIYTMRSYARELDSIGIVNEEVVETFAGHEWLESAVESVPDWFERYR